MTINRMRERFCLEYVRDFNGRQAAIRAGYRANSAVVTASQLLTIPNIKARISELCKEILDAPKEELKARIKAEYEAVAFGRIGDVLNDDLTVDIQAVKGSAAVREVSRQTQRSGTTVIETHKVKLHDKVQALNMLSKYAGMIQDGVSMDGSFVLEFRRKDPADKPLDQGLQPG